MEDNFKPSLDGIKPGFSTKQAQNVDESQNKVSVNTPNKPTPSPRGYA